MKRARIENMYTKKGGPWTTFAKAAVVHRSLSAGGRPALPDYAIPQARGVPLPDAPSYSYQSNRAPNRTDRGAWNEAVDALPPLTG